MPSKILDSVIELNKISFDSSNNKINFVVPITTNGSIVGDEAAGVYANAAFVKANAAFSSANSVNVYGANTQATSFFSLPIGTTAQRPASPIFGAARFNTDINGLEVYTSTGWQPLAAPPTIATVSPSSFNGESGTLFTINGTNFTTDAQVYFVTSNSTSLLAATVSHVSSVQLTATTPRAIKIEEEPISVRVVQQSGSVTKSDVIDAGAVPTWSTSSGSLGSVSGANVANVYLSATDPEGTTVTYELSSGSLPGGLSLSANGLIQGLANSVLSNTTYNFAIKAKDTVNNNTERSFSYTILNRAPVINTAQQLLQTFYSGNAVPSTTISAYDPDGGTLTYSITSGNSVNTTIGSANGVIVGTPIVVTSNTTYTIGVTVTDQGSLTASNTYTIRVLNRPPIINTVSGLLATFQGGVSAPANTIQAYDPDGGSVSFAITSGNLVNTSIGSANGTIVGSAINVSSNTDYTFNVTVTDSGGDSVTNTYTYRVLIPPPSWVTSAGSLGSDYTQRSSSFTVQATSGATYSVVSGSLPTGLSLNSSTGVISGTASGVADYSSQTFNFTIRASNSIGSADRAFSISIASRYEGYLCWTTGEGGTITGTAPAGKVFNRRDFSSYGTPGGTCGAFTYGGCNSGSSNAWDPTGGGTTPVTSFSQTFGNGQFGDPCGGVGKSAAVQLSYGPF